MSTKEEVVTTGIVLRSMDYKDSDSLVTIYTRDYGKVSIIARGVKKIKSKNASGVQTITLSEITFIPRKGLSTLIKASSIDYFRYIKEDIVLEAYASYFVEFVYKYVEENDPNLEIYSTLLLALDYLNKGYDYRLIYLLFNAFILKETGTPLQVDECSVCGKTNDIAGISYSNGGFVCSGCLGDFDKRYDKEFLQAFRHINKYNLSDIDKINIDSSLYEELITNMEWFINEYTGISFKSLKFIKQLSKI